MMPRINTVCPACGVVELDGDDITLVVSPGQGTAWYLFECFGCAQQVIKSANSAVVSALTRLEIAVLTVPAEALEVVRGRSGAPLTTDDLLDLLLELRTTLDVAGLAAAGRSVAATSGPATV